jgi:hypothetical protein
MKEDMKRELNSNLPDEREVKFHPSSRTSGGSIYVFGTEMPEKEARLMWTEGSNNRQRQKSLALTVFRNLGSPISLCSRQPGFRVPAFMAEATWQPSAL